MFLYSCSATDYNIKYLKRLVLAACFCEKNKLIFNLYYNYHSKKCGSYNLSLDY